MTLYMTFEALKDGSLLIHQKLPVSKRVAAGRSPSKLGLRRGERITVNNAIKALITKSANDVATVLAEAMGGTERKFAVLMTERARALGMRNTTFKNASGLPNRRPADAAAEDMATLARAVLNQHPDMYHHFSRQTFKYNGRTYRSHNRLMRRYKGMDGIKTGYIRASGFNLVASAKRSGKRVIAIVFGGKTSKSRDRPVARLLDRGFSTLNDTVVASGKQKVFAYSSGRRKKTGASSVRPKYRSEARQSARPPGRPANGASGRRRAGRSSRCV